jgi:two-component system, NarL family, response regulator DevR
VFSHPKGCLQTADIHCVNTTKNAIRVLLVDDHQILREGLGLLIGEQPDMVVVAEAGDAQSALERACTASPDLVVMDIGLPDGNGLEVARELRASHPAIKIVILTGYEKPIFSRQARAIGASGYILKRDAPNDLIRTIRAAMNRKSEKPVRSKAVEERKPNAGLRGVRRRIGNPRYSRLETCATV